MYPNIFKYCGKTYDRKDFTGDDLAWDLFITERKYRDFCDFSLESVSKKKLAKKLEKVNKKHQKTNLKNKIAKKPSDNKPVMIEVALQSVIKAEPVAPVSNEEHFHCLCCQKDITENIKQQFGDLAKQFNVSIKKVIETRIEDENNRKFYNTCIECVINNYNKKN